MRAKHSYTIKKITYTYTGNYLDEGKPKVKEEIIYQTKKRLNAEIFYENNLYQECGSVYKGIYYPMVEIVFVRNY